MLLVENVQRQGHYEAVCRSNKVNVVNDDDESCFLDVVSLGEIDGRNVNPWQVKATVSGVATEFKLDTGADVSVILFKKLKCQLSDTNRTLTGTSQQKLDVMGTFKALIKVNGKEVNQEIFVVKGLKSLF